MTPTYQFRFWFEHGGYCIWGMNDAAKEAYGYPIDVGKLPISNALVAELDALEREYAGILNWAEPNTPSPWTQEHMLDFFCRAAGAYQALCGELSSDFEIFSEIRHSIHLCDARDFAEGDPKCKEDYLRQLTYATEPQVWLSAFGQYQSTIFKINDRNGIEKSCAFLWEHQSRLDHLTLLRGALMLEETARRFDFRAEHPELSPQYGLKKLFAKREQFSPLLPTVIGFLQKVLEQSLARPVTVSSTEDLPAIGSAEGVKFLLESLLAEYRQSK